MNKIARGCALASLLSLAALAGSAQAQDESAVEAEASDLARALGRLDQSYSYRGLRAGHGAASTQGSSFGDAPDAADRRAAAAKSSLPSGMQMLELFPPEGGTTR